MTASALIGLWLLLQPAPQPAFLDDLGHVTVWVADASKIASAKSGEVQIGARKARITGFEGREKISPKRDDGFVNLPGTLQHALGGSEWDPAGDSTQMTQTGPDLYEFIAKIPAGRYEYKLARGGSWAQNWGKDFQPGGSNYVLVLSKETIVRFVADFAAKTLLNSAENPDIPTPLSVPASHRSAASYTSFSLSIEPAVKPSEINQPIHLKLGGATYEVFPRDVLKSPEFRYDGDDLGPRWTPTKTTFKTWAPTSSAATLVLRGREIEMKPTGHGVWSVDAFGDLNGAEYRYEFTRDGAKHTAADINAFAATADDSWSVVLNLAKTNPEGWKADHVFQGKTQTDAILYEAHVRDLSVDPSSGVPEEFRGKYLGLAVDQAPLQHLVDLGITHVHLLPFQSFNPAHANDYNWGYETTLFNVPEQQYSTRPNEPAETIRQCKQMVQTLHQHGIGVVMDVVYNHSVPSEGPLSAFWETVPYVTFRTNDRGDVLNESGVGNALNDDQPMVRKYICDSLRFWSKEYAIDGFRFDLLGMFQPESVAAFAKAIRSDNPSAVVYGEPWTGGGPLRFPKGAGKGLNVGVFNDHYRNALRGDMNALTPNFLEGASGDLDEIARGLQGSINDFAQDPTETINYLSCHDDMNLFDRLQGSQSAIRLGYAATLLAEGVPFLEGGTEIGRTKQGVANSYNAGDAKNRFDWSKAGDYASLSNYLKGLIQIRKNFPELRYATRAEVEAHTSQLPSSMPNSVAYRAQGANDLIIVLHGNEGLDRMELPDGQWSILANGSTAGLTPLGTVSGSLPIRGVCATVLVKKG